MIIPRIMKSPFEPRVALDQDLSASLAFSRAFVLPPTAGPAPAYQERFLRDSLGAAQTVMLSSTAPGRVCTYEAVLRSWVPRVADDLGAPIPPLAYEATFIASCGATLLFGPKSRTLTTGRPAAKCFYVMPVKAAISLWPVVRGSRAVFGEEWSPRMGFFGAVSSDRGKGSAERAPFLLVDMRGVCDGGALALSRLHSAVEGGSLPRTESGMGPHLYDATSLRGAASMAVAFFGVRCVSGGRSLSGAAFISIMKKVSPS